VDAGKGKGYVCCIQRKCRMPFEEEKSAVGVHEGEIALAGWERICKHVTIQDALIARKDPQKHDVIIQP